MTKEEAELQGIVGVRTAWLAVRMYERYASQKAFITFAKRFLDRWMHEPTEIGECESTAQYFADRVRDDLVRLSPTCATDPVFLCDRTELRRVAGAFHARERLEAIVADYRDLLWGFVNGRGAQGNLAASMSKEQAKHLAEEIQEHIDTLARRHMEGERPSQVGSQNLSLL